MSALLSHDAVDYRPAGASQDRCGNCAMIRDAGQGTFACTLVEPPIVQAGTCDRFTAKVTS